MRVSGFPVNDAEGDALRLRGKRPADGRPAVAHGNRYHTVAAGLDEDFPGTFAELGNIFDAERDVHPAGRTHGFQELSMS